jgi:hypothetical protein
MPIDRIFEIEALDALAEYLRASSPVRTRQQLTRLFLQNVLYQNVSQWNRVVRLCEALTIVGWGELEPVQAVRTRFYNGFPWTLLFNRYAERRYVEACWCSRGDGYMMAENSVVFHGSEDLPSGVRKKGFEPTWEQEAGTFAAQRNWIARAPIWIGQTVVNCYESSNDFVSSVGQLRDRLLHEMRPEVYGRAIDQLRFYFHLSYSVSRSGTHYVIQTEERELDAAECQRRLKKLYSADEIRKMGYKLVPRYLFRPFRSEQGEMNISIHLTKEFSEQSTRSQKLEFAPLLSTAIDQVVAKLRKKRLKYDLDAMQTDADRIIQEWAIQDDVDASAIPTG